MVNYTELTILYFTSLLHLLLYLVTKKCIRYVGKQTHLEKIEKLFWLCSSPYNCAPTLMP